MLVGQDSPPHPSPVRVWNKHMFPAPQSASVPQIVPPLPSGRGHPPRYGAPHLPVQASGSPIGPSRMQTWYIPHPSVRHVWTPFSYGHAAARQPLRLHQLPSRWRVGTHAVREGRASNTSQRSPRCRSRSGTAPTRTSRSSGTRHRSSSGSCTQSWDSTGPVPARARWVLAES